MAVQIESLESPIVGIDLGTTNSLVAIVRNGKPEILKQRNGSSMLPSVISWKDGNLRIGHSAKKDKVKEAKNTISSVKRLLGRGVQDVKDLSFPVPFEVSSSERADQMIRIQVEDRSFTPVEISAMILKELKMSAEDALKCPVSKAVITVPAYFNDSQRQATRAAGRLAGLDVLRIVNEPTAAALAYGLSGKNQGTIAVFDLGGGTFDVSILKLHDGIFEVLATNGNTQLGGDDLDLALVEATVEGLKSNWGAEWGEKAFSQLQLYSQLIEAAEKTKIELSTYAKALLRIEFEGKTFQKEWTIKEFEALVRPIVERTKEPCLQAMSDAQIRPEDLSDVLLVGGPTRLSIVQKCAQEIFGRAPHTSLNPDEVVAQGAAIQADILSGRNKDFLLLDVVPLSLGIETYGGLMSRLITRNTRIPTVVREVFTTFVDGQTAVDIHVLQGERERVEDNRSLARFKLKGLERMPAGVPRIEVTFLIDADGVLQVSAKNLNNGQQESVEVKPSFGLTDAEVEAMLLAGQEHSQSDIQERALVEARTDAERLLRVTESRLADANRLLPETETREILGTVSELKKAVGGKDTSKIRDLCGHLNQSTVHLAELLLRETLTQTTSKESRG